MSPVHSIMWQIICIYLYLEWYKTMKVLVILPLPNLVLMYFQKFLPRSNDFCLEWVQKCKYLLFIHGLTNTMTMFFLVRMWLISLGKFPILHSSFARSLRKFWGVMKSYLIWRFSMYLYVYTLTHLTPIWKECSIWWV